ncbi:hypothetical protein Leryth_023925 [Lithospermum erythrorhizon]|nr:hypothetical protein Leryth_023925 [Lithospermum erythrorhizon]
MWLSLSRVVETEGQGKLDIEIVSRLSPTLSSDASKSLLAAKKVKRTTRTEFSISLDPDNFYRTSDKYMGIISTSEKLSRRSIVATITYELNVFRSRGPRRMLCTMHIIPVAPVLEGGNAPTPATFSSSPRDKLCSPATGEKTQEMTSGLSQLQRGNENSRKPCWCLNFNGRVTVASVKNFQLVAAVDSLHDVSNVQNERVVMQFGKIVKDVFTMDFCYLLCAFQAFAICLSSFDTKPACE